MKIKVGVFFGGKTVEHEVSIITAIQAIENMNKEKYDIIPVYITKDNKMYTGKYISDINQYKDIEKLLSKSTQVTLAQLGNKTAIIKCSKKLFDNAALDYIDIAFPIVHGTNVEDGTLQGYLKMFNIPYVGSDVLSSALGMDKYACKCILKNEGIPVLDCESFTLNDYSDSVENIISKIESKFEYPVIVKPVNLGSSIGINIANDKDDLEDAIQEAFSYSKKIIVEKAIKDLKEVNCSVLGDYEFAQASECEQPVKNDEILSFKDKYISGGKKLSPKLNGERSMNSGVLKLPADITDETKKLIQELSIKTFNALGCSGVIRIDFIIDNDTNMIYVNEVNTIPGSLSFHLWKATNMPYSELIDKLIELSLKRNREEQNITYSFDSNILSDFSLNGLKGTKGVKNMK